MTMQEIEELIKSVNRNAIKAMLRNAAILGDEKATDEMKGQALENVKAIAANKPLPKTKTKIKPVVAPAAEATQLVQTPAQASPAPQLTPTVQPSAGAATPSKIEYPQGLHLSPLNAAGHDEAAMRGIFDALPDHEKQHIADWHSGMKMKKSINTLHDLFTQLKKHI